MTDQLLDDLKRAVEPPAPKDFRPGITYSGTNPRDLLGAKINTPAIEPVESEAEWEAAVREMGIHIPDGYTLRLVKAELAGSTNEAAWKRDPEHRGEKHTAYTAPSTATRWRYQFEVVLKDWRADVDIDALMKAARKATRGRPLATRRGEVMVVALSDFQTGKVDLLGGTAELLERSEMALKAKLAEVRRVRPKRIVLVDVGDSTEGFESAPNANRTNDLQMTEQIRVWRRVLWRWVTELGRLVESLTVAGVPSNHCRVRAGKNALGPAGDDWGLEVIAQVHDIAAANPEAFGHIDFLVPDEHRESLLIDLGVGKSLGVIHGHQVARPDLLPDHIKKNSRRGVGQADLVVVGHFHHLRVQAFGDEQFYFLCPTMDNGSSWMPGDNEVSTPGVLSFVVDERGWHDLHIAWC